MASEVAHVLYADQFFKKKPVIKDRAQFYLGVLFPDIRRVSNVARSQTHNNFKELSLNFKELTDFEKGWKFHVWCDMRRTDLLLKKGFYNIDEVHNCYYLSPHILEDKLIWEKSKKWVSLIEILKGSSYKDVFQELTKDDWKFWYETLAIYFEKKPDTESINQFFKAQPSIGSKKERIIQEIGQLEENKKVTDVLERLYLEIITD